MRQFEQRVVGESAFVAKIGVIVLGLHCARERQFERGRMRIEQPRLPDQIEAHIGERDVLFEYGAVAAPLGVSLSEDECVVCEAQDIGEMFGRDGHGAITCD